MWSLCESGNIFPQFSPLLTASHSITKKIIMDDGSVLNVTHAPYTLEPKLLYLPKKRLEVTSSVIVVLTAFLDSPNLLKEGLSGLKGKFSRRDT